VNGCGNRYSNGRPQQRAAVLADFNSIQLDTIQRSINKTAGAAGKVLVIELNNQHPFFTFDEQRCIAAARSILEEAGVRRGEVSLAVIDDDTMHTLNRRHLDHDYPTDALSFLLQHEDDFLSGEVIVSADTAAAEAAEYGWETADELLLYIVHGVLHLTGYDDQTAEQRVEMQHAERRHLQRFGLEPRYE